MREKGYESAEVVTLPNEAVSIIHVPSYSCPPQTLETCTRPVLDCCHQIMELLFQITFRTIKILFNNSVLLKDSLKLKPLTYADAFQ